MKKQPDPPPPSADFDAARRSAITSAVGELVGALGEQDLGTVVVVLAVVDGKAAPDNALPGERALLFVPTPAQALVGEHPDLGARCAALLRDALGRLEKSWAKPPLAKR